MDLLTHLFLPITVIYVLRPELFQSPLYFSLAVFGIAPDFDKLLGLQGMLHSGVTLGIISVTLLLGEQLYRGERKYALVATGLLFSHLLLDFLDGGPVLLFYPLHNIGVGLQYPAELVLGDSITATRIRNPFPRIGVGTPDQERGSYPLIQGYGVLSLLIFLVLYLFDSSERL